jgi:hypothetical protein
MKPRQMNDNCICYFETGGLILTSALLRIVYLVERARKDRRCDVQLLTAMEQRQS